MSGAHGKLHSIVVNTSSGELAASAGGVWTPVRPQCLLSGKLRWDRQVFRMPRAAMAKGKPFQRIGFGDADSQIWVAKIRIRSR